MTSTRWDAQGEAQAALRTIVADPRYRPAALSNAQTMTNLLKDMPPDSARESSVLVAASEAGIAGLLQSNISQGMDVDTASQAVAEVLDPARLETRALRPAILLVTDGLPTDPPGGFERGLAALTRHTPGRVSLRLAVAIGRDANSEPLDRFRSRDAPVLIAETIDVIVDRLVAASIAVSRMSEAGADRGALAQQLLQPEVVPGSGLDDDPIL